MGFLNQLFGRAKDPTPAEFAELAMAVIAKNGVQGTLEYDAGAFLVRGSEGGYVANLHNAYREYCRTANRDRGQLLERFFAPYDEDLGVAYDALGDSLLPLVRPRLSLDESSTSVRLGEHLEVQLAIDRETRIIHVTSTKLEEWGVDFQTALARAASSLRDRSLDAWIEPAPRLYVSPWRDHHDAARLYLPDLIHRLRVKGDPVAVSPNRLMTIVTGSDDRPGLELMLELTRRGLEQDRPISAIPLRLDGQKWHTWFPEHDHPELVGFKKLRVEELCAHYNEQATTITDPSVPARAYMVVSTPKGSVFTCAVWGEGEDGLLPRSEWVAFHGGDNTTLGVARFEKVMSVLAHRLEVGTQWPPRWRTRGFPTPQELTALQLSPIGALPE
jgi:hypothetical protein